MRAARKPLRFAGAPRRRVLAWEVPVATTPTARLLGLALLSRGRAGAGLLIPGCRSVHTFGMLFELDLLFLDRTGTVIDLRLGVRPGRVADCRGAAAVLELPSP